MAGTRVHRRAVALAATLVALVAMAGGGLVATAPTPASAEARAMTVIWPTATKINPDTMAYEVTTSGINPDLYHFAASARGEPVITPVDADGTTAVGLPEADGYASVDLVRCAPDCRVMSEGPGIELRRRLEITGGLRPGATTGPNAQPWAFRITPAEVSSVDASWQVYASPYLDGSAPLVTGSVDDAETPFEMPSFGGAGLVHGEEYVLHLTFGSATAWGPLGADVEGTFAWDAQVDGSLTLSRSTLYAVRDGYRDDIAIGLTSDDQFPVFGEATLTIRNGAGDVVHRALRDIESGFRWSGRERGVGPLPEGTYEATVEVTDTHGNAGSFAGSFELSHRHLESVEWRRSFPAGDNMIDKGVGRCASLTRPARAAWPGSLGYRSRDRCARPRQNIVSTVHGIYVPYSFKDRYAAQVTVYGGKAKGERTSYLQMFYLNRNGDWVKAGLLDGALGSHEGWSLDERVVRGQADRRPYLVWTVGLGGGYKYDVKKFVVNVSYETLVD